MIQKPKGTYDLYGDNSKKWLYIESLIKNICETYNYNYVKTPTFERSELFHRGIGDSTDIIRKETYDFKDKSDRDMTLRPEGTAGVVRSYIENKMYTEPIVKQYYIGSNFRYERPQSGRLREHTQFGIEVFGSDSPIIDAEVISIPVLLFKMLGLKGIKVKINTLGDEESRSNYKKALVEYFRPQINELCEDCINRLDINPLRILDCKVDTDSKILKKAPRTIDYLTPDSENYFKRVLDYLDLLEIEYEVDPKLVRGLDYYTHTIFEIQADIEGFGSQNTLCGGGRYNNLVETLDGPKTPGIGFGMGLERLLLALDKENINLLKDNGIDVFVIGIGNTKEETFKITNMLRVNGFKTDMDYFGKNISSAFKQADKYNAKYIIIVGEEELKGDKVIVKENNKDSQELIKIEELINYLDEKIEE
jgi:histidyl-tRNA synthetase